MIHKIVKFLSVCFSWSVNLASIIGERYHVADVSFSKTYVTDHKYDDACTIFLHLTNYDECHNMFKQNGYLIKSMNN